MENNRFNQELSERILSIMSQEDRLKFAFSLKFADCLLKRRSELNWTQETLAEKSGVNRATIARLENYQRTASVEVMLKLLNAMGMDLSFEKNVQTE